MTTAELQAIAARANHEGLTEAPWRNDGGYRVYGPNEDEGCLFEGKHLAGTSADMNFCAHARTDVPALLAEVKRLQEENRQLRPDHAGRRCQAMTPAELQAIRDQCDKATAIETFGPAPEEPDTWILGAHGIFFCRVVGSPGRPAKPDATLFAHARADVLALLADVERLRAETVPAHPCQCCGKIWVAPLLFDMKGNVPDGCKLTCPECVGRLEERQRCLRVVQEEYRRALLVYDVVGAELVRERIMEAIRRPA